ncbi:MAG: RNA 3'-terminal phosphate cyclase [Anaeromyxobacteraceae bacterium]
MSEPIILDGAAGEGGGQILRTALSLSAITGQAFEVERLRVRRPKPGLRPQHVAAARAVAGLCGASLEGAEVGSPRLAFRPTRAPTPADLDLDVGTAGSTPLLFHAVAFPLALAGGPSTLRLRGGTHQDHAPSFHHLALVWAPAMARLGFRFSLELGAAGFYPEGGGEFSARVEPAQAMPTLDLRHRGTLLEVEAVSFVCGLGYDIARRQAERALHRLRELGVAAEAERVPMPANGSRGGHVLLVATFERLRAGAGAVSAFERTPEETADLAVDELAAHLAARGAVDPWLADQLLVPAALVAAGRAPRPAGVDRATRYTVSRVTGHLLTNADVVRRFLDVEVQVTGGDGEEGEVRVAPRG